MLNFSVVWGRGGMVCRCGGVCTSVHTYTYTRLTWGKMEMEIMDFGS